MDAFLKDSDRGRIINPLAAAKRINYDTMRKGNITPTDIDGIVEYHGCCWWINELKRGGKEMEYGQRTCLERTADALTEAGKYVVLVLGTEPSGDSEYRGEQVVATLCRFCGIWFHLPEEMTLKDAWDEWSSSADAVDGNRIPRPFSRSSELFPVFFRHWKGTPF
jgi:hypothetical protein